MDEGNESGFSPRWFLVIAVALVAIVVGVALFAIRPQPAPAPAPAPASAPARTSETETSDERAARLAAIDSTQKTAWVDEVPGVDVSRMTPERRTLFVSVANTRRCSCGCGFTLAACRRFDSECDVSGPIVARLADSAAAGLLRDPGGLRHRPD